MTPDPDGRATARGDPPQPPKAEPRRNAHATEVAQADRLVSPPSQPSMARVARVTDPEPLTPVAEVPR